MAVLGIAIVAMDITPDVLRGASERAGQTPVELT
jgi:hypothetical protein